MSKVLPLRHSTFIIGYSIFSWSFHHWLQRSQIADCNRFSAINTISCSYTYQYRHSSITAACCLAPGICTRYKYLLTQTHITATMSCFVIRNAENFALAKIGGKLDLIEWLFLPGLFFLDPGFQSSFRAIKGNAVSLIR